MLGVIKYDVFGSLRAPLTPAMREEISGAFRTVVERSTRTDGPPSLDLFKGPMITYGSRPPRPWQPLVGEGLATVWNDEWNAAHVFSFLKWVSSRFPDFMIRLHDGSRYIRSEYLFVEHGRFRLDEDDICRLRKEIFRSGGFREVSTFNGKVELARAGELFEPASVNDYAERREIHSLRLSGDEYATLTVLDVAERLVSSWLL
jgi:hypothetical protein